MEAASRRTIEPSPPDLPGELSARSDLDGLGDAAVVAESRVVGAAARDAVARDVVFDAVVLERVDLGGAQLDRLRVIDSVLEGCDAANVLGRSASLSRVEVRTSRLTGSRFLNGSVRDAVFRDCRLDLTSFSGASFEHVAFSRCVMRDGVLGGATIESALFADCDLAGADLANSRMRYVTFERCDLTGADLTGARLDDVDVLGCTLDGARGLESLRGARMRRTDILAAAPDLAAALGIRELRDRH